MAILDASVYVALVNAHEKDHARCWDWFEQVQATREPVIAPVILLAEVAAALSRGIKDTPLAHRVVQQLTRSSRIELIPVTQRLASDAAAIAATHRIRGCDAIYIALARQSAERLVTLDRQQLERGASIVETCEP